ncbi:MAG TPA: polysaccharide deacetylase family protein, partial [Candidatus Eremiobacteraceae bacterium]|nr:polysaccharide deacetylase family protein [Candidatus Eremiobacteraceae bacterium]
AASHPAEMSAQPPQALRSFFVRHWPSFAGLVVVLAMIVTGLWYISESPRNQLWGSTVTSVPVAQKVVALTFDDGPNPPYTNEIVEYLHEQHVPATFFLVGIAVQAHPDVARLEVEDGNAVGNHTWDHAHLVLLSHNHIVRELTMAEDEIARVTGVHTTLFRPPFGARDFVVIRVAHQLGLQVIMWSVPLPGDWRSPPPHVIAERVLKYVKNGAIIVLHDGNRGRPGNRENSVQATKLIVTALRNEGYQFVTVPDLLKMGYNSTAAPGPTEYATPLNRR